MEGRQGASVFIKHVRTGKSRERQSYQGGFGWKGECVVALRGVAGSERVMGSGGERGGGWP